MQLLSVIFQSILQRAGKTKRCEKNQKGARKSKGNNWVGVFDFLPSEGNREKSKTPTWSEEERRTEHTKNSYVLLPKLGVPTAKRCTLGKTYKCNPNLRSPGKNKIDKLETDKTSTQRMKSQN